jgi:peptide/nickel transport system permease protein
MTTEDLAMKRTIQLPVRDGTPSARSRFWSRFARHHLGVLSLILLVLLALASLAAPRLAPYDPNRVNARALHAPPSAEHWLGTDEVGRDVLSRLLYAGRVSLSVGAVASIVAVTVGILIGMASGYLGGAVDFWLMRFTEVIMTIPTLIIIITLIAAIGPNIYNVMIVIGLVGWTEIARLVRAETLSLRNREFVTASQALGAGDLHILFQHILPNVAAPVLVAATFFVAYAILLEAALSFLGIGVRIPTATWGNMLNQALTLNVLENMPWLWLPPGLLISLTVLSVNFVGDALRYALDPRLQVR